MKKIIKSIIAFFFRKKDNQTPDSENPQQDAFNQLLPGTYYTVYFCGIWMGYHENLFTVSKTYPVLKKSTLYNAFKGEKSPRTYEREDYTVIRINKA